LCAQSWPITKNFTKHRLNRGETTQTKASKHATHVHAYPQAGLEGRELTPVTAVPAHAQARGSRYHGAFEIKRRPKAYEVTDIKTDPQAFTSSISNT
jgi:hypothetical protein